MASVQSIKRKSISLTDLHSFVKYSHLFPVSKKDASTSTEEYNSNYHIEQPSPGHNVKILSNEHFLNLIQSQK